jgi:hypothetical protein
MIVPEKNSSTESDFTAQFYAQRLQELSKQCKSSGEREFKMNSIDA